MEIFKSFPHAELSWPQIINSLEIVNYIFTGRNTSGSNYQQHGNIQSFIRLQKCLSRKSSLSRKNSKIFSPAELSQPQIIDTPKICKQFFTCRYVLAANHHYPENIQRLFRLQNSLRRRSSTNWKYSKTFSPADLSWPQVIDTPKIFKDFFTCRIVLAANDQQHGNIQIFSTSRTLSCKSIINNLEIINNIFTGRNISVSNYQQHGDIQSFFRLQKFLSPKSSLSRKNSKIFLLAKLSQPQIIDTPKICKQFFTCRYVLAANHHYPENIQRFFRLQNCLSRRSSMPRKYSKTFSPADLSWPQVIDTPKIFKDFFTCRIVLPANDQQHGNIQIFSTCRTLLAANHQQPGNSQRHFHRQKYLSLKLSTTWKHSKFFSLAEFSYTQIINNLELFKDSFACKTVLAADHRCPGNIQTLFHLQICLNRKSSTTWKNSTTFSPAEFSQTQTINNLELIKDFFACKTVLAANHHYPENIQRIFSPADFSQTQIINKLEIFKDFFACRFVLAAGRRYHKIFQRLFHLQNCLSRK